MHVLISSEQVLAEVEDVLLHRLGVPLEAVSEILSLLRRQEIAVLPVLMPDIAIRDPDDLAIVAAAIESRADFLVTGDKDITSIAPLEQVRILTPRDFWSIISNTRKI